MKKERINERKKIEEKRKLEGHILKKIEKEEGTMKNVKRSLLQWATEKYVRRKESVFFLANKTCLDAHLSLDSKLRRKPILC